jgi:hypothetical protein
LRQTRKWKRLAIIDVFGDADRTALGFAEADLVMFDQRWRRTPINGDAALGVLGEMPMFSANANWEPSVAKLRRSRDKKELDPFRADGRRVRLIIVDAEAVIDRLEIDRETASVFVSVADWTRFQSAIFAILDNMVAEVVWACEARGVAHRSALQACACSKIAFYGFLDALAVGSGELPHRYIAEMQRLSDNIIGDFKTSLPRRFALMDLSVVAFGAHTRDLQSIGSEI